MEVLVGIIATGIGIILGVALGIFICSERMRKAVEEQSVGYLRIDRSEPDEPPKAFWEITKGTNINVIAERDFVILKVVNESYISHD